MWYETPYGLLEALEKDIARKDGGSFGIKNMIQSDMDANPPIRIMTSNVVAANVKVEMSFIIENIDDGKFILFSHTMYHVHSPPVSGALEIPRGYLHASVQSNE